MATSDLLVWVDCEMTGLDLINDELIEVAALVTDANLNVLGDGVDLVIKPSHRALEQMGEFVRGMHESSGLLNALDGGLSMAEAEQRILDYVRAFVAEPGKAPLAGNTIGTDRAFRRVTCRPLNATSTTAASTSPASRNWFAAGIPACTTRHRPRPETIARSPMFKSRLRSCGTTARRSSWHSRDRTVPQPGRLPIIIKAH